jgi:hypothetical protein
MTAACDGLRLTKAAWLVNAMRSSAVSTQTQLRETPRLRAEEQPAGQAAAGLAHPSPDFQNGPTNVSLITGSSGFSDCLQRLL